MRCLPPDLPSHRVSALERNKKKGEEMAKVSICRDENASGNGQW